MTMSLIGFDLKAGFVQSQELDNIRAIKFLLLTRFEYEIFLSHWFEDISSSPLFISLDVGRTRDTSGYGEIS